LSLAGANLALDITTLKPGRIMFKAIACLRRRGAARAGCRARCALLKRSALLFFILAGMTRANAQGILAPTSSDFDKSTYAPVLPGYQTGGVPQFGALVPETLGWVQWGVADLHPRLDYQFVYGDGIPASPTNHVRTAIQSISPGLRLNLGSHWKLDYDADMNLYSSHQFADETDQSVKLSGNATYEDWAFGMSQSYGYSDSPMVETEAQTQQSGYATDLMISRQMGSRLSAKLTLDQDIASSSAISGAAANNTQQLYSWIASGGLYYQTDYKLVAGIDASGGYTSTSPGTEMEFEQLQSSLNWQPLEKLTVSGSAGVEDTQLLGSQLIDPTFSAAINYQPFEQTSLSLTGSRTVNPSIYQDEVVKSTQVSATLRQRFLKHFSFEVSGGYSTSPYVGFATQGVFLNNNPRAPLVTTAVQQNRSDESRFVRVGLSSTFRQRGTVSIFYSFSDISSSLTPFALSTTQVGFEIGWHY
jgi:hypothetical protein